MSKSHGWNDGELEVEFLPVDIIDVNVPMWCGESPLKDGKVAQNVQGLWVQAV